MSVDQYLQSVKAGNPQARAYVNAIEAARVKVRRAELGVAPEAYVKYNAFDDQTPPLNPGFAPSSREGYTWRAGVRKQTTFGLNGDLYFDNSKVKLGGVNPAFFPLNDYTSNRAVLELKQSIFRNGFGESVRSDITAQTETARAELYDQEFNLTGMMMDAANTYWALVTYNHIVKLQEENVDRAKKLSDWMGRKAGLNLYDDVDALQTKTAYESRVLELETSKNERAVVIRAFNTLRGVDTDQIETLQELPAHEWMSADTVRIGKTMIRQDFSSLKARAKAIEAQANIGRSSLKPEVDLVGSIASNGLDPKFANAYTEVKDMDQPSWTVGINISFPLSFGLTNKLMKAVKQDIQSAKDMAIAADFNLGRAWKDLMQKRSESLVLYNKSVEIEKLQTMMVKKEQQRLRNGRTTTFQMLTFEQNLALAQIQRTRAQLGLIQINNLMKTFEVSNESI